jgi:hypothetical protein
LLESCNLHTILDCPGGTFQGAGVKTVVLFFEKGAPTRKTWYYQLDPGRSLGKTNPLNDDDLKEFVELQKTFAGSPKSWSVDAGSIDQTTFDLSVKNPDGGEEIKHRSPQEIMDEIAALDAVSARFWEISRRCYEITCFIPVRPELVEGQSSLVHPELVEGYPIEEHHAYLIKYSLSGVFLMSFWVYILLCTDSSYYTGHTDNLEKRIAEHHAGAFANCYTFNRRPLNWFSLRNFQPLRSSDM